MPSAVDNPNPSTMNHTYTIDETVGGWSIPSSVFGLHNPQTSVEYYAL